MLCLINSSGCFGSSGSTGDTDVPATWGSTLFSFCTLNKIKKHRPDDGDTYENFTAVRHIPEIIYNCEEKHKIFANNCSVISL